MNILYIPGLGSEESLNKQRRLMFFWPDDSEITIFEPNWASSESAEEKYIRLKEFALHLQQKGRDPITLVGVSAGGSLAIRYAYENPNFYHLYLLSAKIKGSGSIGPAFQKRASALLQSVIISEKLLEKNSVIASETTSLRPIFDDVVPTKDMVVAGSKKIILPAIGHTFGIVVALLAYMPRLLKKV